MEEEKGSSSSNSRWNPTKEQIKILEGLYRQGIRTPSAEQIQKITTKLREYGCIEGKNVFYWFQNHKARQRQKQKQESFVYYNRLLHQSSLPILSPPPPPPSTCTTVVCNPFCLPVPPVGGVGFYQPQCPKVLLPGAVRRRPRQEIQRMEKDKNTIQEGYYTMPSNLRHQCDQVVCMGHDNIYGANATSSISQETLPLFPLHPTGILEEGSGSSSLTSVSVESESLEEEEEEDQEEFGEKLPYFNFFGSPQGS